MLKIVGARLFLRKNFISENPGFCKKKLSKNGCQIDGSPFLGQLRLERVIYLRRKPYYPLFERNVEIGIIFAMKGSRRVLVEVV